MELKYENTTRYSEKIYKDFLEFHTKQYFTRYIIYTIIVLLAFIYMLFCSVEYGNWKLVLLIFSMIIGFIIYRIYSQERIVKKEMNSPKIVEQEKFTFKFYDKIFTVNNLKQIEEIKYAKIYKTFETKNYFYLYINKTNAFILGKSGFKNKDINEFRDFLKIKLKRKYKIDNA